MDNNSNNIGSTWNRWDLHLHTPSSYDYGDKSISEEHFVESLINAGIRVAAITDHHVIDVERIRKLQAIGNDRITFLPGIELRDVHGAKPIHYIGIFPEDCNINDVWITLQGTLGLTETDLKKKGGDEQIYVPIDKGSDCIRKNSGIVSIHAGAKANSIEEISNSEQYLQRLKYDIINKNVDIMEIGQIKDIHIHFEKIFKNIGIEKALVLCSDNHNINNYTPKTSLWLRAMPTFRGLLMAMREPRNRIYIGDNPPQKKQFEQNATKYIKGISFNKTEDAPDNIGWFSGNIDFNPGLVVIIGNKGSGKSALVDTIGLLGNSKNGDLFSFLNKERFLYSKNNLGRYFQASIYWQSGESTSKLLNEQVSSEVVENVKYLPQEYVEQVCNELVNVDDDNSKFNRELKSVIFSHIPVERQLGCQSLDELISMKTKEKKRNITSLLGQMQSICSSLSSLENQSSPSFRKTIEEKIKNKEAELQSCMNVQPKKINNPAEDITVNQENQELLKRIDSLKEEKDKIRDKIRQQNDSLASQEKQLYKISQIIERIEYFIQSFGTLKSEISQDISEFGLDFENILSLNSKIDILEQKKQEIVLAIDNTKKLLDVNKPDGLLNQLNIKENEVSEIQEKLDGPNQQYQSYLKEFEEWEQKRVAIIGNKSIPESLNGLKASLAELDTIPEKISTEKQNLLEISTRIYEEKMTILEVYKDLYFYTQEFVAAHNSSPTQFQLEFHVELIENGFADGFLNKLAQNRKGNFQGQQDGRNKVDTILSTVDWNQLSSVHSFFDTIDEAIHFTEKNGVKNPIQLSDQLSKNTKIEEVYQYIYGLEYLQPHYTLKWEGKDVSFLSAGERGTLLLVFYLLIDKSDIPLIIDQPEGNLDNLTIAKIIVRAIKYARDKRQVFLVTHNPNLAVVCDADQVIYSQIDKCNGNRITYISGALEDSAMTRYITDVLEGSLPAFQIRDYKYSIGHENEKY